jgi:hypothetical protein
MYGYQQHVKYGKTGPYLIILHVLNSQKAGAVIPNTVLLLLAPS